MSYVKKRNKIFLIFFIDENFFLNEVRVFELGTKRCMFFPLYSKFRIRMVGFSSYFSGKKIIDSPNITKSGQLLVSGYNH